MSEMPVLWDDDVVRQYLTPESHQKSQEEFLKTHIDINKIRAEYLYPHSGTDEFVTQEEFRDALLKSSLRDDNRIFILRGETGSGKSQLCQWLEYQIGGPNEGDHSEEHVALHVSRSKTRLSDILEILMDPLDESVSVANVEDLNPKKVADAIITTLEAFAAGSEEFTEEELMALTKDRSKTTDLRSILIGNIEDYQDAVAKEEREDIPDLIDVEEYRDLSLAAFSKVKGTETLFPALRSNIHTILSQNLGVQDFKGKLEEISEKYVENGMRPVLICEDLTTFSVLKEQLLDHIFQLDSGHLDVVLGWTTGWEKDDLQKALGTSEDTYTYMEERAEGYLSTTDDDGEAYFLDEDVTVKLARKYMGVIIEESDVDSTGVDLDAFDGLYPFNPVFVQKAYEHLQQDGNRRRTPRMLLIRVLKECLNATVPPFEAMDENPYINQFATNAISYTYVHQELTKWYGFPTTDRRLRVPKGILATFNIDIPDDTEISDGYVLYHSQITHVQSLDLDILGGSTYPGGELNVQVKLDTHPEPDVSILTDGKEAGTTGPEGTATVVLPDEERDVIIRAEKDDLSDELELSVGTDSIQLSADPSDPDRNEEVELRVLFNGEPVERADIFEEDEQLGQTNPEGTYKVETPDQRTVTYRAVYEGVEESISLDLGKQGNFPVDTSEDPDDVEQDRHEFQQWLSIGEDYPSRRILQNGARAVLKRWHEPTRLANSRASTNNTAGIYYARGSNIPVSVQGVYETQDPVDFTLEFGSKYTDVYDPMFWCGVSDDDELPYPGRYNLNYDLLRSWVDNKVVRFRQKMREDIESALPSELDIERLIVVAQFFLLHAADGRKSIKREDVFSKYDEVRDDLDYEEFPIARHFGRNHSYTDAFNALTTSKSVPPELAEGFFLLKSNVVDADRLDPAFQDVSTDPERYVSAAVAIDPEQITDGYRIGTSRSSANKSVQKFLEQVKEYALELDDLQATEDATDFVEEVESISQWFDPEQDVDNLLNQYETLYKSVSKFNIGNAAAYQRWENGLEKLKNTKEELQFGSFRSDLKEFQEIVERAKGGADYEPVTGLELISVLHEFQKSQENRIEWKLYEYLNEMIEAAESMKIPEGGDFEQKLLESEEMAHYTGKRERLVEKVGGD